MTLDIVISPAAADSNVIALTTRQRKETKARSFFLCFQLSTVKAILLPTASRTIKTHFQRYQTAMQVKAFHFSPTSTIPNSSLPLLYYAGAFPESCTPSQIETKFRSNGWIPQVPPLVPLNPKSFSRN